MAYLWSSSLTKSLAGRLRFLPGATPGSLTAPIGGVPAERYGTLVLFAK